MRYSPLLLAFCLLPASVLAQSSVELDTQGNPNTEGYGAFGFPTLSAEEARAQAEAEGRTVPLERVEGVGGVFSAEEFAKARKQVFDRDPRGLYNTDLNPPQSANAETLGGPGRFSSGVLDTDSTFRGMIAEEKGVKQGNTPGWQTVLQTIFSAITP